MAQYDWISEVLLRTLFGVLCFWKKGNPSFLRYLGDMTVGGTPGAGIGQPAAGGGPPTQEQQLAAMEYPHARVQQLEGHTAAVPKLEPQDPRVKRELMEQQQGLGGAAQWPSGMGMPSAVAAGYPSGQQQPLQQQHPGVAQSMQNPSFYRPTQPQVNAFFQQRAPPQQSFQPNVVGSPGGHATLPAVVRSPGSVGSPGRIMGQQSFGGSPGHAIGRQQYGGSPGQSGGAGWHHPQVNPEQMFLISAVQYHNMMGMIQNLEQRLAASEKSEKSAGRDAPFPPPAASSGYKYYYVSDRLSKQGEENSGALIGIGWKATEGQFRQGMPWSRDGSVRGFQTLEEAVSFFIAQHKGRTVIELRR